jgi:hypothetical protein
MVASIYGEINQVNWSGRSARGKEERWEGNGEAAFIDGAGIGHGYMQGGGDSARNFAVLVASRAEKRKGEGRGIIRLFIGAAILENKLGFGARGGIGRRRRFHAQGGVPARGGRS